MDLELYFVLLKLVEARKNSFPMKMERVFGCSCTVCTAFNIGSCGKRNGERPNSPNLKTDFHAEEKEYIRRGIGWMK